MPYTEEDWKQENLKKKELKPITNVFAYNPRRVAKEIKFQSGIEKNSIRDSKIKALAPGKRISKTGKTYWETRASHSDLNGKIK
jgi:hypothetical protein